MSSGTLARRPAVLLALGLCAFGGVVTLLGRLAGGPVVEQKRVQFTSETGAQAYPSFSPDGKQLAFSARGAAVDDPFHIVTRPLSGGQDRQITNGPANDIGPVWSPDGSKVAFLRVQEGRAKAVVVPAGGGVEVTLAEFDAPGEENLPPPSIAWTRDGKSLVASVGAEKQPAALAVISADGGGLRPITKPPEGSQGDGSPAISPDGKSLAFVRTLDDDRADVYVTDLNGAAARQLSFDNHQIHGLTWTSAGQDILYASNRGSGWRIWRLPAYGGSPRDVISAGDHAGYPAVAPAGDRLAYTDTPWVSSVWMGTLGSENDKKDRQVIRGAARESGAVWSPDGSKIANISESTGQPEVWVQDASGANRIQLTHLDGPNVRNIRWSPDGRTLLFETRGPAGAAIYRVPAAGGKVTRVLGDAYEGSWSHNGKWIYYSVGPQVWRAAADGSKPEQLSHRMGSNGPVESADGNWLYFRSRRSIWRMPVEGGKEEEFIVPDHDLLYSPMQVDAKGLYYSEFDRSARGVSVMFYDFAAKKSRQLLLVRNGDFGDGFSVSPDGKQILYTKTDRSQTNLMLIENFR